MIVQNLTKTGDYIDAFGRVIILFQVELPGYECSLIEFGLFAENYNLAHGSKYFFLLPRENQEILKAEARKILPAFM